MAVTRPEDRRNYTPEEDWLIYNRIVDAKARNLDMMPVYDQLAEEVGAPSGGAVYQVYRRVLRKQEKEQQEQQLKELEQHKLQRQQAKAKIQEQQEKAIPSLEEWKAQQREKQQQEQELTPTEPEKAEQPELELPKQPEQPEQPAQQMTLPMSVGTWRPAVATPGNSSTTVSYYQSAGNATVTMPVAPVPIYPNPTYGYMPGLLQERDQLKAELEAAKEIIRELEGRLATIRYITEPGK